MSKGSEYFLGYYNLPAGIVLSVPVTFADGKWSVLSDVSVGDKLKERLQLSAIELRKVCQITEIVLSINFQRYDRFKKKGTNRCVFLSQEKELGSENCTVIINKEDS